MLNRWNFLKTGFYEGINLHRALPQGDRFLSAINRYFRIIRGKTMDMVSPEGYPRPGVYFMPERDHYRYQEEQGRFEDDTHKDAKT